MHLFHVQWPQHNPLWVLVYSMLTLLDTLIFLLTIGFVSSNFCMSFMFWDLTRQYKEDE